MEFVSKKAMPPCYNPTKRFEPGKGKAPARQFRNKPGVTGCSGPRYNRSANR